MVEEKASINSLKDLFLKRKDAVTKAKAELSDLPNEALACACMENKYLKHDMIVFAKKALSFYSNKKKKWNDEGLKEFLKRGF